MTFALSDDQKAVRDLARQIFATTCTKEALDKTEADGGFFSAAAWRALSESGLISMAVDESHGGGGLGLMEQALVLRQAGQHVAPVPVLESAMLAAPAIAQFGPKALRDELLAGLLSGKDIATVALNDSGSRDPELPAVRASAPDGDENTWTLNGDSACVPWWNESMGALVPATDGETTGLWWVTKSAAETSEVRAESQTATDNQPLTALSWRGCPATRVGGDEALKFVVQRAVLGRCAMALGIAKMALELTAEFCRTREQFGAPIGTFQAVSQRAGDMYVDTQVMELALLGAAWSLQSETATEAAASTALWTARYWATEAGHRVVAAAQHLHGGTGFDRDYPVYRCFLRARRLELGLGTARESLARLGDLQASAVNGNASPASGPFHGF